MLVRHRHVVGPGARVLGDGDDDREAEHQQHCADDRDQHQPSLRDVDLRRQPEVLVGDAALVVGAEGDAHLPVADVEVGVVVHRLGLVGDPVHEEDGLGERRELERLHDLVALARPPGERRRGAR